MDGRRERRELESAGWYVLELMGRHCYGGRGLESAGYYVFFLEDVVAGLRSDRKRMGRIEGGTDVLPSWWCGRHCLLAELQMNGEGEEREMRGSEGRN